jgi:protein-disulfide isomerase
MPLLPMLPGRTLIATVTAVLMLAGSAFAQTITTQQAEEILKELRAIRQAIERQQAPAPPQAPPALPESVQIANVSGHALGRADAPLTMIEFTDLQCPFCNRFATATFDELKKEYIDSGKMRFISRDFPLDFHAQALPAARASRCAGDQGKYWDLRIALVKNASQLSPAFIAQQAASLKLDMKKFDACTTSTEYDTAINKDMTEGAAFSVNGTPTFFVGKTTAQGFEGFRIVGAQPFAVFQQRIEGLLK